jgi:hypothetical protein
MNESFLTSPFRMTVEICVNKTKRMLKVGGFRFGLSDVYLKF